MPKTPQRDDNSDIFNAAINQVSRLAPPTGGSWWVTAPREQFSDVVAQQLPRMRKSPHATTPEGRTGGVK